MTDLLAFIIIHHNYFKNLVFELNDENEAGPLLVSFKDQTPNDPEYEDNINI